MPYPWKCHQACHRKCNIMARAYELLTARAFSFFGDSYVFIKSSRQASLAAGSQLMKLPIP